MGKSITCRICGNKDLKQFLSLGTTPLANSFLKKEELDEKEEKYPLNLVFCDKCKLVTLSHVVDAEKMFSNYVYVTSTTKTFRDHFTKMGMDLAEEFGLDDGSLAVDIGSNDGVLLSGFKSKGVKVVGVEPAANIAKIAELNGVPTINDFFGSSSVLKIVGKHGKADVVTATNVFAHINDIKTVLKNVKYLLKEDGVFVIEIQYFMDTIKTMNFDNVYHEHLSYFTLTSLKNLFEMNGMNIFKVEHVDTHGGSLRVFIQKNGGFREPDSSVKEFLVNEEKMGVDDFKMYESFGKKVYDAKEVLVNHIKTMTRQGKKIAAYGAPAKGNTLLNFCGIGNDAISYVVEDNPLKVGLYTPGTRIPVVSSEALDKEKPDVVLILAWNFAKEIMEKNKKHKERGVQFIVPLPEPRIV